jgi:hypothetical protein
MIDLIIVIDHSIPMFIPIPFPNIPSECRKRNLARIVSALVVALVAVVAACVGTARDIAAIGVQPAPGALSYR